jgi:transcriptional regulator with XRE-family HTH domain
MNTSNDIRRLFAIRLRELRKKNGLSVSQLARKAQISRQHIRELEIPDCRKYVTIKTLCKLSKAFDRPVWEMLKFKTRRCTW